MICAYRYYRPEARPDHKRRHYCGCTQDLKGRLKLHRAGQGARLLRAFTLSGVRFRVVRTWTFETAQEAWEFEQWTKRYKNHARLCPHCQALARRRRQRAKTKAIKARRARSQGSRRRTPAKPSQGVRS